VGVTRSKLVAYLIAALGCGAAGAIMLVNSLEAAPDSAFNVQWTAYMIFCVMVAGLGTIEGPVRFRQGIWGLLAARTRISLFPVGYRVNPITTALADQPREAGTGTGAAAESGPPAHVADTGDGGD
jgi:hypothetical protein